MRSLVLFLTTLIIFSSPALADYEYSEDEGKWITRAKFGLALSDSSEKSTVNGVEGPNTFNRNLVDPDGYLEGEVAYFYNNYVSFGASISYLRSKELIATFSGRNDTGNINMYPISALVNFHIAPYGTLRPYIGAGVHYTRINTDFQNIAVDDSSGFLLQAGADYWFDKKWGVNLEIKQYFMEVDADLTQLTTPNTVTQQSTVDPLLISGGFVFRF